MTTPVPPLWQREPWRSVIVAVLTALLTIIGGGTAMYVGGGCPRVAPPPPDTKPETPPEPERPQPPPDPWNAIGKVIMRGGYCSGTVVGPRRPDGRWHLVSAAHCFSRSGEEVTVVLRQGQTFRATVVAINKPADCAILLTDHIDTLPFAEIAPTTPPVGERVWHGGYGVHVPGNKEIGRVAAGMDANGQTRYRLSVSSGDSGGGIIHDASGRLLSPVCCTTRLAGEGDVWGAAPEIIQRMIATPTEWVGGEPIPPVPMPLRQSP